MKITKLKKAPEIEPAEGVKMAIIGDGEKMTFVRIEAHPGSEIPDHSHPNEQIGTCVDGEGILVSGGETLEMKPGVAWAIPPGEVHRFKPVGDKPCIIHEVFSPPREDYRKMAKLV